MSINTSLITAEVMSVATCDILSVTQKPSILCCFFTQENRNPNSVITCYILESIKIKRVDVKFGSLAVPDVLPEGFKASYGP
jgi:hypothetical protein